MSLESGGVTIGNGRPSGATDHRGHTVLSPADAWPLSVVSLAAVEDEGRGDGADDAEGAGELSGGPPWSDPFDHIDDIEESFEDAPTAPYPLPPEDRLWRHPSELRYLESSTSGAAPSTKRTVSYRSIVVVAFAAGLVGAAATAGVMTLVGPRTTEVVERVVERQSVQSSFRQAGAAVGVVPVADIAAAVTPSVVRVEVFLNRQAIGSGSGVIIRDDGHIITNAHVVEDGTDYRVVMAHGDVLDATLVGMDTLTDIAVLRVAQSGSEPFVPAAVGTTTELRAGDPAIAIGSPLRLAGGPTVTLGVVSAVNRRLQSPNGDWLYDLVQTDAPISPGSSGGALVDSEGALVGITTVIAVSEVGAEGLGFATPVEIAHEVATDIITWGAARHGFLGLRGLDASRDQLAGSGHATGVLVQEVGPDGPAERAGIMAGDIIVALDARPVEGMSDLVVDARLLEPGNTVTLELLRDGRRVAVNLVVGQLN